MRHYGMSSMRNERNANERNARGRNTEGQGDGGERKSLWIPWLIVPFFAVIFIVNGIMVDEALTTWRGVETDHPYEDGNAYQKVLDAAHKQAKLGWQVHLALDAADRNHANIAVTMRDKTGAPIYGAKVHARIIRPVQEGYDSEVLLREMGNGRYAAETAIPLPGQWDIVIAAWQDGNEYQLKQRVFIPK